MRKLIATTVAHGARRGESHGGAFLVDLDKQAVHQVIDQDADDVEWFGNEGGRGLRGLAFDGSTVYVASSNKLLAFTKRFEFIESWQNPYLINCHNICVYQRKLYLASTGNDCILAFDLDDKKFHWAMQIEHHLYRFKAITFDPLKPDGPLPVNKLQLLSVRCGAGGMHISGLNTGGVLHFSGEKIRMSAELPTGAQDAQFFRSGAVFNDPRAGVLRYTGADEGTEDRAMQVPFFTESDHSQNDPDATRALKRGYARGLCVLSDTIVAGGCTPAGVTLYNLKGNERLLTVTFTRDVRTAINCIEIWPFD